MVVVVVHCDLIAKNFIVQISRQYFVMLYTLLVIYTILITVHLQVNGGVQ